MTTSYSSVGFSKRATTSRRLVRRALMLAVASMILFPVSLAAEEVDLILSEGVLKEASIVRSDVCNRALDSNIKRDDGLYEIEKSLFFHAQTSDTDPNRNQRVQDWWIQAMPHIDCYDRVYNGFEGGSPLNLMAYAGYGRQIIYLMRKYELPPQYMVYPDPRTGLNLFEWMEERSTDADLYDERNPTNYSAVATERIANELRLLTRWFTRIGYFE